MRGSPLRRNELGGHTDSSGDDFCREPPPKRQDVAFAMWLHALLRVLAGASEAPTKGNRIPLCMPPTQPFQVAWDG